MLKFILILLLVFGFLVTLLALIVLFNHGKKERAYQKRRTKNYWGEDAKIPFDRIDLDL